MTPPRHRPEKMLPEVVRTGKNNKKKVAYMELIPVLIEAVKEQQGTINKQMLTITELNQRVSILEKELKLKDSLSMASID